MHNRLKDVGEKLDLPGGPLLVDPRDRGCLPRQPGDELARLVEEQDIRVHVHEPFRPGEQDVVEQLERVDDPLSQPGRAGESGQDLLHLRVGDRAIDDPDASDVVPQMRSIGVVQAAVVVNHHRDVRVVAQQ